MRIIFIGFILVGQFACSNQQNSNQQNNSNSEITKLDVNSSISCNYIKPLDGDATFGFKSDEEASTAIKNIMKYVGLPANFLLQASDIDNAAAVVYAQKRYILYNQRFIEEVKDATHTRFGPISILAHEAGHHLAGHTLSDRESRPNLELEADRFSGFVLAKMGATLNETLAAMEIYGSQVASLTHPAKRTRIAAITNGWKEAKEESSSSSNEQLVTKVESNSFYEINVVGGDNYITMRNRSLSPDEYKLANSGTEEGRKLNRETVIRNLPNGTMVEVLSSVNKTYFIKAKIDGGEIIGYIAKNFAGRPSITPASSMR